MVATALYRRYRPDTFAEVIGQDHVTVPLTAALNKDRVNHAYLFSGPRGCGKTTSARILARCLNCAQGPTATPCGVCESCVELARGGPGSLDVVEIDAASHGGVDDARSLRERAAYAPARDRYKIFIIDEAHMVSTQGFNALLKIVEEPPAHVRFVFATTEPEKVIGTIRSRTHHYPFRLVPPERLQVYLAELCEAEGVQAGPGVLPLVVRAGAGSVRDSLSVLDQLIAGSGSQGLDYAQAASLLGFTDATLLDDIVDALAAGDGAATFAAIDRVIQSGQDPRRFVEDLLERLRDLIVVAATPDGAHSVFRGLPSDQLERMSGQAGRFGAAELSRAADVVNTALTEMTGATSPRLQLELLAARLLLPAADDAERGLRARLDRVEKRMGVASPESLAAQRVQAVPSAPSVESVPSRPEPVRADPSRTEPVRPEPVRAESPRAGSARTESARAESLPAEPPRPEPPRPEPSRPEPARPAPAPEPPGWDTEPVVAPSTAVPSKAVPTETAPSGTSPSVPVSAAADGAAAGAISIEQIRRMWPDVLTAVSQLKRATWSLVSQHAQAIDYDGTRLLLEFSSPSLTNSFSRGSHHEFLHQALIDVLGLDCRIDAVAKGAKGDSSASKPAASRGRAPSAPAAGRPGPAAEAPAATAPAAPPAAVRTSDTHFSDGAPLPEEPPLDEPPPDEGGRGASSVGSRPPAQQPRRTGSDTAAAKPQVETQPQVARRPSVAVEDDVDVSPDDEDIEGSNQVGMPVVAQLLGGTVIEEREE